MRVWFSHRLRVVQHILQEDYAEWFHNISPQARQAESALLFVVHGLSPYGPNLGVY